jgi:hypothetical protein
MTTPPSSLPTSIPTLFATTGAEYCLLSYYFADKVSLHFIVLTSDTDFSCRFKTFILWLFVSVTYTVLPSGEQARPPGSSKDASSNPPQVSPWLPLPARVQHSFVLMLTFLI